MTDPLDLPDDAATLLGPEERDGLIPSYITLRGELNAAEQENILEAEAWEFCRRREKNIGIDWRLIPQELHKLLDDCRYWIENETYEPDETAARFHHRMVWIHCYPNGNGRHGRLAADLLLVALGRPRFSWGRESLVDTNETRQGYIAALRAADGHDFAPLLAFVRS